MKNLLITIISILIIVGCHSSTGPTDQFQPYHIGTWLVTSPTQALYIGESKNKITTSAIDSTIDITQPGQYLAQLTHVSEQADNQVYLDFTDSKGLQRKNWPDGIGIKFIGVWNHGRRLTGSFRHSTINENSVKIRLSIQYVCWDLAPDVSKIRIILYRDRHDKTTSYRQYVIHAAGFIPAIQALITCPDN